ncbi:MAG: SDR family oxidoreductase [Kiritimatiellaeota bacterium]|nr:SDR family oxidoreductase [Kiritimatiellota bacterium]
MVQKDSLYVVMGLLDADSIAYAIGREIQRGGGRVVYTVQNDRLKRVFFDRSDRLTPEEKAALTIEFCDVTRDAEVRDLFCRVGPVAGVVHSIAFANPKTCLGDDLYTEALDDLKTAFHISCASLATVAHYARPHMPGGGAVVALSFESRKAFPFYNWMGVNKAALEALVRALARQYGRQLMRVNAISAGPLTTRAAKAIPHYAHLARTWRKLSPLPWDPLEDKLAVAHAAAFLLGPYSKKITGQVLYVDGGASVVGGNLLPQERPHGADEIAALVEQGLSLSPE